MSNTSQHCVMSPDFKGFLPGKPYLSPYYVILTMCPNKVILHGTTSHPCMCEDSIGYVILNIKSCCVSILIRETLYKKLTLRDSGMRRVSTKASVTMATVNGNWPAFSFILEANNELLLLGPTSK